MGLNNYGTRTRVPGTHQSPWDSHPRPGNTSTTMGLVPASRVHINHHGTGKNTNRKEHQYSQLYIHVGRGGESVTLK
jgi:hypothetical protein